MLLSDDRLRFGVCWYPEHWPKERWPEDVRLMKEAGLQCVRIGESAWTLMEPAPGRFDWSLLDDVLALCQEAELGVILGTPTYAPPAWLESTHPEVIARRQDGSPWYRHSRRCYDYTQPAYREACDRIVEAMAERYAGDERLWAWQVDNEMWCHLDELWGDSVRRSFQHWLERRYGSIQQLNAAWGMSFWSNQLSDFEQADLPGPTPAYLNHHQCADYRHFLSDLALEFLVRQIEQIRAADPQAVVLHNCPFGPLDRAALLEHLDVYGHDHYPRFAPSAEERPAMGANYGRFRAYAPRLWVVEQQASQVGQTSYRLPSAPPGELAVAALQSIGHGCNLVSWFRWRSFPAAQETNWGGLLPHWGEPGRHFREAQQLIHTLTPHAERIANTRPVVAVARLASYRQSVGAEVEPWIREHIGDLETGRRALRRLGLNEDTLRPGDIGTRGDYMVALLPLALALDADEIAELEAWVRAGGVLVVGPMAGHRDEQLHAAEEREPPGLLSKLTGTRNGESTTWESPVRLHAALQSSVPSARGHARRTRVTALTATRYAEILEAESDDCQPLAVYTEGWLAGHAAITARSLGKGRVLHCGVALCDTILEWLWESGTLPRQVAVARCESDTAEVLTRRGPDLTLHFVLNYGAEPVDCQLNEGNQQLRCLESGRLQPRKLTLPPYGYRLLYEEPKGRA